MGTVISKIDMLFEEVDNVNNVENEYLDIHDDIRIHVYYDDDGFVWDAIEGEYIVGSSDVSFATMEEAEVDAKNFIGSYKGQEIDNTEGPENPEEYEDEGDI